MEIDDRFDFRFQKIQHDVKKGEFLIHFESNLLPAETYLKIEHYFKENINGKTRLFISYRDARGADPEDIEAHIKGLCLQYKKVSFPIHFQDEDVSGRRRFSHRLPGRVREGTFCSFRIKRIS